VSTLRLDTLGGRIDGKGEGTWEPGLTWDAELTADGIDPSKHWPDWPGRLGGRVATQGRVTAEGPDLGAQLEDIKGELRGYAVAAAGKVLVVGETVTIKELNASSGPSKARVSGTVGERMDLAFAVDSPDLGNLLPDARGSIKADGTVLGTAAAPEVKLRLGAKGVQVAGQGVQSVEGDVDLGLGPDGRFAIRLNGKDLTAAGLTWQTLEVRGDGAMAGHRLTADLNGDALSLRLKAGGALKPDNAYQGDLAELELASKDYGNWRLQRAAPIVVAQPRVSVGPLCLRDGQGSGGRGSGGGSGGCVRFEQTDVGKWNAELDLDRLAFSLLTRFLPSNLDIQGAASLKGRFVADGPLLTGNAAVAVPEGRLQVTAGGQTQILDFSNTRLGLDSDARGLSARLHLPVADIGGADADLTLAGWRLDQPARPDQPLSGRVQARVTDLRRIASLVPDLAAVTGTIDLDLGLAGTLARPGVKGGGRVSGGGFDAPIIGLKVRNVDLRADAQSPSQVVYRGGLDLGGGRLELTGDSVQETAGWLTKVRISGQRLKVADSKEYFALISPDIGLQIGPTGLDVTGELRVPEARIRPRAIPPGTVSPSGDVVLEQTAAKQAEPFPIAADLRLVLGDAVSIDAFGLRGLLRGDLRVIKSPGREPVGDGQISVVDATYRLSGALGVIAAVGKPLKVEQGILVFAKTPLNNPGLVLTAQREGGDVTAGVRVLGTIKKPKLAFFSESDPDMSQSEITSYLVTGIPPKRGSAEDARALAVGTYISPKLYMEYESNLGDSADKVKLRYELSNRIELQTETGSGQGADIFYKFEN
jgi:translocation and assembly module TamB